MLFVGVSCHVKADHFIINDPSMSSHILIAGEKSEFKDSLVHEILEKIETLPVYIEGIDISGLDSIRQENWQAIIIIHAIHVGKAPKVIINFIDRVEDPDAVIVVSTSGGGSETIEGVDGISSASRKSDVELIRSKVIERLKALNVPGL